MAGSRALRDVMRGEKGMVPKKGNSDNQSGSSSKGHSAPRLKEEARANTRREVLNSSSK